MRAKKVADTKEADLYWTRQGKERDFCEVIDRVQYRRVTEASAFTEFADIDVVRFRFGKRSLVVSVDTDTDEIILGNRAQSKRLRRKSSNEINQVLAMTVGKELTWAWSGRNAKGYRDLVLLSFSDLTPQIAFLAAASNIRCLVLQEAQRVT